MEITPSLIIEDIVDNLATGEAGQSVANLVIIRTSPGTLELDYEGCPTLFKVTIEPLARTVQVTEPTNTFSYWRLNRQVA